MSLIIDEVLQQVEELRVGDTQSFITAHILMLSVHIKALACHCECLGMNAENSMAVCEDKTIPYADEAYSHVMQKWELIDKEGKPII
jgi:hypothetical protein